MGDIGLEPTTPSLSSNGTHDASGNRKGLAPTPSPVCTRVCTSGPENANADALEAASLGTSPQAADTLDANQGNEGEGTDQGGTARGSSTADQGDPLAKLAAVLLTLSPADRARLATMLAAMPAIKPVQPGSDSSAQQMPGNSAVLSEGSPEPERLTVTIDDRQFLYDQRWQGQALDPSNRLLALDTETDVVDLKRQIPRLALASVSASDDENCLIHPDDIGRFILAHRDRHFVCHNAAFDFWVIAQHLQERGQTEALQTWWTIATENRLHDSMLLDALVRLARDDSYPEMRDLAVVAKEYTGLTVSKDDPYRMRYAEIIGQDWTTAERGFFDYAAKDAIATRLAYQVICEQAAEIVTKFGGFGTEIREDAVRQFGLLTEAVEVKKAIALAQITRNGMCVDVTVVREREAGLRCELMEAVAAVQEIFPIYKTDKDGRFIVSGKNGVPGVDETALRNHLREVQLQIENEHQIHLDVPITSKGVSCSADFWAEHFDRHPFLERWGKAQKLAKLVQFFSSFHDQVDLYGLASSLGIDGTTLIEALGIRAEGPQPRLLAVDRLESLIQKRQKALLAAKIELQELTRQAGLQSEANRQATLTVHPSYSIMVRTGRTSCSSPNIQQIPRADTFRQVFIAPPGYFLLTADYAFIELRTLAATTLHRYGRSQMAEVIRAGRDPHAYTGAMMLGVPHEEFLRWKNNDTLVDDPAANADGNGIRLKDRFDQARQAAKAINFGVPGGLGAASLVDYARKTYTVTLSLDEAKARRDQLTKEIYPELDLYLAEDAVALLARNVQASIESVRDSLGDIHISSVYKILAGDPRRQDGQPYRPSFVARVWDSLADVNCNPDLRAALDNRQPSEDLASKVCHSGVATLTGRIRGRVQYSQARNTPFQGLAADGAALALFDLIKEGFVVTAFVHDEVHILLPDEGGYVSAEKVNRVQEILCRRMEEVLVGDIPVKCEAALSVRWSKKAKLIECNDKVYPWRPVDPRELQAITDNEQRP